LEQQHEHSKQRLYTGHDLKPVAPCSGTNDHGFWLVSAAADDAGSNNASASEITNCFKKKQIPRAASRRGEFV
jgi:hypothetical protein